MWEQNSDVAEFDLCIVKIISCIDRMRHRKLSGILKCLISEVTVAFQYAARYAQKREEKKKKRKKKERRK